MNVCHHPQRSRGTQRRSPRHPDEPLNALLEQADKQDLSCRPASAASPAGETLAAPAVLLHFLSSEKPGVIFDPAFLCTFLI